MTHGTVPKKNGRPSGYTEELAAEICQLIASGKSLVTICSQKNMPTRTTIYDWLDKHKRFADNYARARDERADFYADESLDIADNSGFDAVIVDGRAVVNSEAINRARLRIDTRKWYASKLAPKKYGEKVEATLVGAGGGAVEHRIEIVIVDPAKRSDAS